jgi:hypothetical protein
MSETSKVASRAASRVHSRAGSRPPSRVATPTEEVAQLLPQRFAQPPPLLPKRGAGANNRFHQAQVTRRAFSPSSTDDGLVAQNSRRRQQRQSPTPRHRHQGAGSDYGRNYRSPGSEWSEGSEFNPTEGEGDRSTEGGFTTNFNRTGKLFKYLLRPDRHEPERTRRAMAISRRLATGTEKQILGVDRKRLDSEDDDEEERPVFEPFDEMLSRPRTKAEMAKAVGALGQARTLLSSTYPAPVTSPAGSGAAFFPDLIQVANDLDLTPSSVRRLANAFLRGKLSMAFQHLAKHGGPLSAIEELADKFFTQTPMENFDAQIRAWRFDPKRDVVEQLQSLLLLYAASTHRRPDSEILTLIKDKATFAISMSAKQALDAKEARFRFLNRQRSMPLYRFAKELRKALDKFGSSGRTAPSTVSEVSQLPPPQPAVAAPPTVVPVENNEIHRLISRVDNLALSLCAVQAQNIQQGASASGGQYAAHAPHNDFAVQQSFVTDYARVAPMPEPARRPAWTPRDSYPAYGQRYTPAPNYESNIAPREGTGYAQQLSGATAPRDNWAGQGRAQTYPDQRNAFPRENQWLPPSSNQAYGAAGAERRSWPQRNDGAQIPDGTPIAPGSQAFEAAARTTNFTAFESSAPTVRPTQPLYDWHNGKYRPRVPVPSIPRNLQTFLYKGGKGRINPAVLDLFRGLCGFCGMSHPKGMGTAIHCPYHGQSPSWIPCGECGSGYHMNCLLDKDWLNTSGNGNGHRYPN